MFRPFHILAVLALLAYCAPLRTCMLQEWIVGSSCHDAETAGAADESGAMSVAGAEHGCAAPLRGDHDGTCVCEKPRLSADRPHLKHAESIDAAAAPVAVAWAQLDAAAAISLARDHWRRPPDLPAPPLSLPLLN